jgi:hypothetical protein
MHCDGVQPVISQPLRNTHAVFNTFVISLYEHSSLLALWFPYEIIFGGMSVTYLKFERVLWVRSLGKA